MNTVHQSVVQTFCTKLEAHINSGIELSKALHKLAPIYNKATVEQQVAIRDKVALIIGKVKGVKPKVMEKGAYKGYLGFDAHGTEAENQARTMLQYYFPTSIKKAKSKSVQQVAKQVDAVEELLAQLYKLSKKEQDRFHKLYSNDRRK